MDNIGEIAEDLGKTQAAAKSEVSWREPPKLGERCVNCTPDHTGCDHYGNMLVDGTKIACLTYIPEAAIYWGGFMTPEYILMRMQRLRTV